MDRSIKRRLSAWLLLLVFVPVMVATSLHVHDYGEASTTECELCVHHVHHGGHLNPYADNVHDCLLCQFASLLFVAPSIVILPAALWFSRAVYAALTERVSLGVCGVRSTRAPPLF